MHILTVTAPEEGIKLINFLAKRLEGQTSSGELHRWIRTGQVRVNKSRAKAFDRLQTGDAVRLPPFAASAAKTVNGDIPISVGDDLGRGLRVLAVTSDYIALEKPAGLPSQPGSGHDASVVSILKDIFSSCAYTPAPAHRLDKNTSGILLAGRTHTAQEHLHALFSGVSQEESLQKTYVAWVFGDWPHDREQTLCDTLTKENMNRHDASYEIMRATKDGRGKNATSRVTPQATRMTSLGPATLLRVALETGRTHQIRVQLASRGFPVIGDAKYGGKPYSRMLLHACRLVFSWRDERVTILSPPGWTEPFEVVTV